MAEWGRVIEKYRLHLGVGVGVVLVLIGLVSVLPKKQSAKVEILSSSDEASTSGVIVVDVEGAVERPGVYELEVGARVNDALVAAGGMSEAADRNWVKRFINLAQRIPDGAKVYIPITGEAYSETTQNSNVKTQNLIAPTNAGLVDINTASKGELEKLWGIGEARAEAIINNRPYSNIEEIKTKARVPDNVFARIKDEITILGF